CAAILECSGSFSAVLALVSGPKVSAFYRNLAGDYSAVCVDRHAASIAQGVHLSQPTVKQLRGVDSAYTAAAEILNTEPAFIQAVCWVAYRAESRGIID